MKFITGTPDTLQIQDQELTELLQQVFVEGGYTDAKSAAALFEPTAVRNRGILIGAREKHESTLAGMVIVVPPTSPARRIAQGNETEMHLLAVKANYRMRGLGRLLVEAAIDTTKKNNYEKIILWTQPTMEAAYRLYETTGFRRALEKDFSKNDRDFLVFERNVLP